VAIVKMKRIGLVGPLDLRDPLLDALQDTATLDPVPLADADEPPADLTARRMTTQRVLKALEIRRKELKKEAPAESSNVDHEVAEATLDEVESLLSRRADLENRQSVLAKEIAALGPWGDFDPADLGVLAGKAVHLQLYEIPADELGDLDLSKARWHQTLPLDSRGKELGLAVLSLDEPLALDLDQIQLPTASLSSLRSQLRELEVEMDSSAARLGELSAHMPAIKRYSKYVDDQLRYAEVKAGLGGDEELFALSGWCPIDKVDGLRSALKPLPVALLVDDPDDDEEPPIQLRNGFLVRQFQPLLGAFNLPNYREYDPTLFIAPFMGIFFGFCLGDLGYGIILTAVASWALIKFDLKGDAKLAVQWMVILGACTVLVGGLTGNAFGVQLYKVFNLSDQLLLFSLNAEPQKFFYASLGFGVLQLTIGMLIRLVRYIQLGRWQAVVGQLGWLSVFPSLAVWVIVGTPWMFVGVLLVILLFASPSPSIVRRIGGGAWALYNITGLVGDVMSYARIFGLGLSSGIIAMVVNTIAMTMAEGIPVLGWVLAVLTLIAGHTFNFGMAMIGSVVHPARLQFLEYFGKFFEGGGRAYAPFRKLEGE